MLFSILFAGNTDSKKNIDYNNNFEKYWEKEDRIIEYLKRTEEDYKNYRNTKFDDVFELNVIEQSAEYGRETGGNILVVVYNSLYNPMTMDDFANYKSDLESEGYSVKLITSTNNNDHVAFRDFLYKEWTNNNIEGAFFIGGLPVSWYEMPMCNESGDTTGWNYFPCDLYYMDIDGEWIDNERDNGIYDDHKGPVEMDIWVGRLYTPTMTYHGINESQLVERYLQKTHKYREGILRLKDQAFCYVDKDWAGFHPERDAFILYNEVTFVKDGIDGRDVTADDYRYRIRATTNNKYEWMYLAVHSDATYHEFQDGDGTFYSEEIDDIDVQVLFYLNFNCSAARFTDDDCLCSWYVMQEPYGLLSISSSKPGGMFLQNDYYGPLNNGYTFGEAFKYWGVRHFEEFPSWFYGLICTGDPTLKISRFMSNPGPNFCYAVSPVRDAIITEPIFRWTAADSTDYYKVEITSEDQIVLTSEEITDTLFQLPDGILQSEQSYDWTVMAYSGSECIDFSQKRRFKYIDPNEYRVPIVNPDFEQGSYGWSIDSPAESIDKTQAHHGNASLRHCLSNEYNTASNFQTINVLNGTYTLYAWIRTSGDQYSSRIEIKSTGGDDIIYDLPKQPTTEWTLVSETFEVTSGLVYLCIYSHGAANSWMNIDDMSLVFWPVLSLPAALLDPQNEGISMSTDVLLDWEDVPGSTGYQVFLLCNDKCILDIDTISQSQFQIPGNLLEFDKTYQWYVRWKKDDMYSEPSDLREFSVMNPGESDFYLSDLVPEYPGQDWEMLGFDGNCAGNPITIAGQAYEKGLGTYANRIIRYNLSGCYKWFTANIGHDDQWKGGDGVTFEVKLEGNTVYGPGSVFLWGTPAEYIEIDVTGGHNLELLVHDGGKGDTNFDYADWANAKIWVTAVGIEDYVQQAMVPQELKLIGNYPNPFNSSTTISFAVPDKHPISMIIYNVLGQKVKTLVNHEYLSGKQTVIWDGTNGNSRVVTSGVYFCRITNGNEYRIKKILFLR